MADRDVVGGGLYVLDLDSGDLDSAVERAEREVRGLGRSIDRVPDLSIAVEADTRNAMRAIGRLDRDVSVSVDVDANTRDAMRSIGRLDRDVGVVVDVDADTGQAMRAIGDLESSVRGVGDVQIGADARAVGRAEGDVRRLSATIRDVPDIDVDVRGLASARQGLAGIQSGALAASAAVAVIAGGFAALTVSIVRSTRELRRWADIAGVSAKQGQVFSRIAARTSSDLDSVADAQKELNLRVDEFLETGAGPAAEALERLGFDEDTARGLIDADQGLQRVIDSVLELDSVAARGRVLDELLGGTGAEAVAPLVEQLRRAGQSADDLFDTFARSLVSEETINQVEELGSSFAQLNETFRARFTQIIANELGFLAPFFDALTRLLEAAIERSRPADPPPKWRASRPSSTRRPTGSRA